METVIGNEPIRHFFETVLHNGTLHHAYCLVGREHVGKRRVAETVAANLLHVPREKLSLQPDYFLLQEEINEKTGKLRQEITVDQIRNLRSFLERRSFSGGYKVAVIDHAGVMSESAANALLKTLEEPTEKTILFLIAEDESTLPGTILSRCQTFYFSLVSDFALRAQVPESVNENDRDTMVWLAAGRPGLIQMWINDAEAFDSEISKVEQFEQVWSGGVAERFLAVEQIFKKEDDETVGRESLLQMLTLWEFLTRHMLQVQVQAEESHLAHVGNSKTASVSLLITAIDRIKNARELITENIHPRLVFENIILSFP